LKYSGKTELKLTPPSGGSMPSAKIEFRNYSQIL
jgi:hypothetical protein